MYPYIEVFGRLISTYLIAAVVGIIFGLALALFRRRSPRFNIEAEDVILMIVLAVIGAIAGAKSFQLIGYIFRDWNIPGFWTLAHWKTLMPTVGVFYGGLIGGFFTLLIYVRKNKLDFWKTADLLTPSVLLFSTFGRIGCFLAGCCYGRVSACGIIPMGGHLPLIPVQLYEAAFTFIVLLALLFFRPERKRPGVLLPIYIISYAVGRFILEFFRGDLNRGVYILSTSQWISLLMIPVGIFLLMQRNKKVKIKIKQ